MPVLIEYLLKVSLALAVVYLFYQMVLRRLTFYNWNRWYLTGYSLICFAIPLMNITNFLFRHELESAQLIRFIPVYDLQINDPGFKWDQWTIVIAVLITGMLIMGVRMLLQLLSLKRIKTKATLLNDGDVKLFHVDEQIVPFSFNNGIYINRQLHTEAELHKIIRHEFVHIKQQHSIDILFAELLCMLLWFHPAAWLIRKAIRQNLEFIADEKVLQDGIDKKQYQYLLLKVVGNSHYSIAPNFNFSSLKNRIIMMNQMKSARVQAIRFLFVLPFIAVLLLSFRQVRENRIHNANKPMQADTVPPSSPLPANVQSVNVLKDKKIVTVTLKNGKKETYNLKDAKQKEAFEKKYGELNPPPPPPPSPASAPAENTVTTPAHEQAVINAKGYFLTIADNHGECIVIVKDKDKKIVEAIKLTDWTLKEAGYEKKYGKIPSPPPPAPAEVSVVSPAGEVTVTGYGTSTTPSLPVVGEGKLTKILITASAPESSSKPKEVTAVESGKPTTQPATLRLNAKSSDNVLYILDGKEVTVEEVNAISPNEIESVSVLKGENATKAYGEKGKYGVIIIKTKK